MTLCAHVNFSNRMTSFTAGVPMTPLWFAAWQPKNAGTTVAACIGLFGLAVLVKLLAALRHQANLAWSSVKWNGRYALAQPTLGKEGPDQAGASSSSRQQSFRQVKPWIAEHDFPRGILAAIHAGLEYFLMVCFLLLITFFFPFPVIDAHHHCPPLLSQLAVMTFNVYFFVAILLGLFAGEVAFGRWFSSNLGTGAC